ncbi:MAG: hypothetical protein CMP91_03340 [Gammaproteobacteria bacterium]|nr:hypothetical protein [Gammaproteobacteria bacterium]|tara:strand:- start:130363 stop:131217 length:855 start_codon:yes stop_codon:yes gene_type:complete
MTTNTTTAALSSRSISFDEFLENLDVPSSCELNKPIFKKMFSEATDGKKSILDAADKKALKDDVEKIRWLYTLKPNTINIAPYKDSEREYPEIAILHVELSSAVNSKNIYRRVAHFINRAIPYPLVILFTCEKDGAQNLAIVLAEKRINQADKEKWVIEDSIQSYWINLASVSAAEMKFFESLKINNLPFSNFFAFYQALIERLVAIKCAEHSGDFSLERTGRSNEKSSSTARLDSLRELERLEAQRSEISNKLKKIKQMGKQVELNTQIKKINDEIANIKGRL